MKNEYLEKLYEKLIDAGIEISVKQAEVVDKALKLAYLQGQIDYIDIQRKNYGGEVEKK